MAKILIVDDEEHIRFLYSEELSEAGYEVITADSGYRLLERIEGEEISRHLCADSLFIHLRCPRCDGEFTLYSPGWSEDYLKERIVELHPEIEDRIDNELLNGIIGRVLYHGDC